MSMLKGENDLHIFLVAPQGYDNMVCVYVAIDEQDALSQALHDQSIYDLVAKGVNIRTSDVTIFLDKVGYDIIVMKKDIFQ